MIYHKVEFDQLINQTLCGRKFIGYNLASFVNL